MAADSVVVHFWNRRGPFPPDKFKQAVQDCKKICTSEEFEDVLAGWDGLGDPVFAENQISFNGIDDKSCETFSIENPALSGLQSCRTDNLPYDMAVRCCLIILRHHLPEDIEISSSNRDLGKWREAQHIVNDMLELEDEFALDAVD
jgi:hypothetical protein